ncbi:MAG TPA: hypothetical protein DDZ53_03075 [Firmicutes bacterium]|nr:hypothetical protein [Bacillota bacterium]
MYTRAFLGLIVIVLGGASWFLAIFYPKQTINYIKADSTIKNSRSLIRLLRLKLALNGALLILLGVVIWTHSVPDYVISIIALVLVGFSYYSEKHIKSKTQR